MPKQEMRQEPANGEQAKGENERVAGSGTDFGWHGRSGLS